MSTFGILIKQSRENRGMTVRALADAIGKSPGYISRIEVRGEIPSVDLVVGLAKALEGDVERFLECAKTDSMERATNEVETKYQEALALFRQGKHDAR
jgi:transcriptional regulator with XRE-family HTH domain